MIGVQTCVLVSWLPQGRSAAVVVVVVVAAVFVAVIVVVVVAVAVVAAGEEPLAVENAAAEVKTEEDAVN